MTSNDIEFFRFCHSKGWVSGPLLDIGSSTFEGAQTSFSLIARDLGVKEITGADITAGTGVDLVFDFSMSDAEFGKKWSGNQFQSVVIFNVLEHTFDPYQVLRNAARCVKPNGFLLTLVPVVWPIHSFPSDYCRLLPDWFEEFSKRQNMSLLSESFFWLSAFGMKSVTQLNENGERVFPSYHNLGQHKSPFRFWVSKISHRLLNTYGRTHLFTHSALGAVFKKPGNPN